MNTFAIGSLPVHFSVAKLFTFRWQYTGVICASDLETGFDPTFGDPFNEEQNW